jgi:hypothetical protein
VLMLSVGLPSVEIRVDRGEVRCCGLIKVWDCGDGWNPSGDVVSHARICVGASLRSRHPRITGATTCPV